MRVPLEEAALKLDDLVERAEAGEEVVLTRDGSPAAQLVAIEKTHRLTPTHDERRRILEDFVADIRANPLLPGPSAARSQDFLYDDDGLPA
jgi:prevent-host-death family protein